MYQDTQNLVKVEILTTPLVHQNNKNIKITTNHKK